MRQNLDVSNRHNLLGIKLGTALAAAGMKKVEFAREMGVDPGRTYAMVYPNVMTDCSGIV